MFYPKMLLAKCFGDKLPNDICRKIAEILKSDIDFGLFRKNKNTAYVTADDLFSDYNYVYDQINLIFLYCPSISMLEIKMHFSNRAIYNNSYVFFESNLPEYILDDWFEGTNYNKIILVWESTYFR